MLVRLIAFLVFLPASAVASSWLSELRDGDVIFHTSQSSQSLAVQKATGSPYSHMGIIFFRGGKPHVFEAVSTVRYTPVTDWVARGKGQHFVVKRLAEADRVLTPAALGHMRDLAAAFHGRPYDLLFGWSDDALYCSELVWKLYEPIGVRLSEPRKVADFNLTDPLVQRKAKERYPNGIPLGEPAVAPSDIFDSPRLKTVLSR